MSNPEQNRRASTSVFTQGLLAVVLVTVVVISAIIVVYITRPDRDNSGIITTICSVAAPTLFALLTIIKSQANAVDIQANTDITTQAAAAATKAAAVVDAVKEEVKAVKSEIKDVKDLGKENAQKIEVIHIATNSLVDKRVAASEELGFNKGVKSETDKGKSS